MRTLHRAWLLVLLFPPLATPSQLHGDLLEAAKQGETQKVVELLGQGADVDATGPEGETALMYAAANGRTETVKALLQAGANVDLRDHDGVSALFVAALQGHTDIVRALLDAGANVNAKSDNGATALILAAVNGPHPVVVSTLLAAKADLDDLLHLLTNRESVIRVRAIMALAMAELGPFGKRALPAMAKALEDQNLNVRYWAAMGLKKLGPEAEPAVPQLIEALKTHPEVTPGLEGPLRYYADTRWVAADALGAVGPGAAAAVPELQKALQDEKEEVREAAAAALAKIQGKSPVGAVFIPL